MYRITVLKYVNGVAWVAGVYFNEDEQRGVGNARMVHGEDVRIRVELAD